jgi:hypothetical protein
VAIRVECPNCKQTLEAPDEFAGRVAICPACRTRVQIPSVQIPAARAIDAPPQPTSPQPLETKPRPTRSVDRIESIASDVRAELRTLNRRLGCLIGLVVIIAALGITAAYLLFRQASQLY